MKNFKLKLATLALIAGLSFSATAADTNESSSAAKMISAKITLPEHLKKSGYAEKVRVMFTVNENGNVTNVAAVTANKELKAAIENQFLTLSFGGLKANAANSVVLNFKVY
jgi:hypothetical protein